MRWIPLAVFVLAPAPVVAAPVPTHLMKPKEDPAVRRASLVKLAATYDQMAPEGAAAIVRRMIDEGQVDRAAQILILMKARNAERLIEAMEDSEAVATVWERMRQIIKQKALSAAPAPHLVK